VLCWFAFALLLGLIVSCGGGADKAPASGTPSTIDVTGNWEFTATSTVFSATSSTIVGAFRSTGAQLSGTLHISGSPCFDFSTNLVVTGTLNGTAASLNSSPVNGHTVSVRMTVTTDGSSASGTYSVAGGCAAGDTGNITGFRVPPVTGGWGGAFTDSEGRQIGVSASLQQGAAEANGFFPLTGTTQFTNSVCFTSGTVNGSLAGTFAVADITTNNGTIQFEGRIDWAANALNGDYFISDGSCSGDFGSGSLTKGGSPPPVNLPAATFTANPTTIRQDQSSTLSWTTNNATSVTIDKGIGTVPTSGSRTVSPSQTTTYTLTASGPGGTTTATATVTVTLPSPTAEFSANPNAIQQGQSSTLSWETSNATSVTIDNGIGTVPTDGSVSVSPSQTTTYTLTATGAGGTVTESVTVTVTPPAPTVTFSASPTTIQAGQSSTLSWTTTNATSVTIDNGIGTVPTNGSVSVSPSQTTTYTLTATGPGGTVTASVTVTVGG
jgi:hypothetical protein